MPFDSREQTIIFTKLKLWKATQDYGSVQCHTQSFMFAETLKVLHLLLNYVYFLRLHVNGFC